jgi:predicted AAA+ superfamily ATPase
MSCSKRFYKISFGKCALFWYWYKSAQSIILCILKTNYFEDTGLRNTLIGYRPGDIGKLLENVVYNHLVIAGYTVYTGKLQNREVDFIAERNGETIYVQVCYLLADEKVMDREFSNLLAIPDNYKKYVVSRTFHLPPKFGDILPGCQSGGVFKVAVK